MGRVLGIGAALAYGISSVLVKQGVADMAPPLVGATIALLAGTFALAFIGGRDLAANMRQNRKATALLLLSGVAAALGIISSFFALSVAPVVVVGPVQSINPLFALLWSRLFLGHLERITLRLVLGIVIVIVGVILISIGRAA